MNITLIDANTGLQIKTLTWTTIPYTGSTILLNGDVRVYTVDQIINQELGDGSLAVRIVVK